MVFLPIVRLPDLDLGEAEIAYQFSTPVTAKENPLHGVLTTTPDPA
jgi:hypothetical protein